MYPVTWARRLITRVFAENGIPVRRHCLHSSTLCLDWFCTHPLALSTHPCLLEETGDWQNEFHIPITWLSVRIPVSSRRQWMGFESQDTGV